MHRLLPAAALALLLVPIVTTVLPQLRSQWPGMLDKFNHVVAPQLKNFGVDVDTDTGTVTTRAPAATARSQPLKLGTNTSTPKPGSVFA